jgi:glycosyltransferase involved in cell wall biosynthesis
MRIAHVGSKGIPSRGGTERVVEALAVRQALRHDVTAYGSSRVTRSGTHGGAHVIAVPTLGGKYLGPLVLQLACAAHVLFRGEYDVVHLHASENAFLLPLLQLRYPVVLTSHGPAYWRAKWSPAAKALMRAFEGWSVRLPAVSTAVAGNQAGLLEARYGHPVVHVPNGVDELDSVNTDRAKGLLAELGLSEGEYWLFAAARVDPTKGCHTLIEAYRQLTCPPPLVVLGDLHHARGYERRLRTLAQGLTVHFVPRVDDRAVVLGLVQKAGLFIFPSEVEAMSMMLLETLAVGTLAVASDIPENTSVLPDWYPLFRVGDCSSLRERLEQVWDLEHPVRRALAQEARDWVEARFRWDDITVEYEELYAEAIAARRSRPPLLRSLAWSRD